MKIIWNKSDETVDIYIYGQNFSLSGSPMKFEVIFMFKDGSNISFSPNEEKIIIGRDPSCTIPLTIDDISRKHLMLRVKEDKTILLTDLGSKNGTYVNNLPLTANTETKISNSDTIEFGPIKKMIIKFPDQRMINITSILKSGDIIPENNHEKTMAIQVLKNNAKVPKLELEASPQQTRQIQINRKSLKQSKIEKEEKASSSYLLPVICFVAVLVLFAFYYMK